MFMTGYHRISSLGLKIVSIWQWPCEQNQNPTLIVYGSADRVVDPAGAQELYKKIESEKRIIEIAGGKHEMFADEERKPQFFEAISSFFSEHI
jgi:alpha-beta hydrolase superfamily lysophospholipase